MTSVWMNVRRTAGAMIAALGVACASGAAAVAHESWSGVFIGAHVGPAESDVNADLLALDVTPVPPVRSNRDSLGQEDNGVLGGAQIGARVQRGQWVYGAEVSWSATDLDEFANASDVVANRTRQFAIDDVVLAGVQVGYIKGRNLVYGKAGYANAELEMSSVVTAAGETVGDIVLSAGQPTTFSSEREDGWHVGLGYERRFGHNLSAGVGYDYIKFDGTNRDLVSLPPFSRANHENIEADIHAVTVRVNYTFNLFG